MYKYSYLRFLSGGETADSATLLLVVRETFRVLDSERDNNRNNRVFFLYFEKQNSAKILDKNQYAQMNYFVNRTNN